MISTIKKLFIFIACFHHATFAQGSEQAKDLKVYVMLGMHTSFYHSWRGDTPDNDGFGQDIRIIRHSLSELDKAKKEGLDAKAYWDFTVHWTLGEFAPKHSPDILEKISQRILDKDDEVLVGPYNNGSNSAVSQKTFVDMLHLSMENPGGYGLKQVFPKVSKIYRPQEAMLSTGQVDLLVENGFEAIILPYSTFPFTSFSNFVEVIPFEKRFNPIYLRDRKEGKKIVMLPSISVADLLNFDSLENLMLRLRKLQESGEVKEDLVININFDADAESWEPMKVPIPLFSQRWLQKKVPNTRGIREYIEAVNKYSWASFTTPKKYLDEHPKPTYEVYVPHDLADGAFDGYHSWAERDFSHRTWTLLERSRLEEENTRFWSNAFGQKISENLAWNDSGEFYRALGASTTHYGMSTPFINHTRIERSKRYANLAYQRSKELTEKLQIDSHINISSESIYSWSIFSSQKRLQKIKVLLEDSHFPISLIKEKRGKQENVPFGFLNTERFGDKLKGELWFIGDTAQYSLIHDEKNGHTPKKYKTVGKHIGKNVELLLGEREGIQHFKYNNELLGDEHFMQPFLTYRERERNGPRSTPIDRTRVKKAKRYEFLELYDEIWGPFKRGLLQTDIKFNSLGFRQKARGHYYFTTHPELEGIVVDVKVQYPFTLIDPVVEKDVERRYFRHVDWHWKEVAPFEIRPRFKASAKKPFKILKENYMGVEGAYFLNFGDYNKKNEEFDSLNNHVTAHYFGFSNGEYGLAISKDNKERSSFAFAPIRLRKNDKNKHMIRINPFGSYFGDQFDYSHLGGSQLGTLGALKNAPYIDSNAPTFNGKRVEFRLLLKPFKGDHLKKEQKEELVSFSDGSKTLMLRNPYASTLSPLQFEDYIEDTYSQYRSEKLTELPKPYALAPNAKDKKVYLVWEYPFPKYGVEKFQVDVREKSFGKTWQILRQEDSKNNYLMIENLENGKSYEFRVRAIGNGLASDYSIERSATPTDDIEQTMFEGESGPVILWKFFKSILRYNEAQKED